MEARKPLRHKAFGAHLFYQHMTKRETSAKQTSLFFRSRGPLAASTFGILMLGVVKSRLCEILALLEFTRKKCRSAVWEVQLHQYLK